MTFQTTITYNGAPLLVFVSYELDPGFCAELDSIGELKVWTAQGTVMNDLIDAGSLASILDECRDHWQACQEMASDD